VFFVYLYLAKKKFLDLIISVYSFVTDTLNLFDNNRIEDNNNYSNFNYYYGLEKKPDGYKNVNTSSLQIYK
jgi:hypothetical protein